MPPDEPVRPRTAEERRIAALEAQLRAREKELVEKDKQAQRDREEWAARSRKITPAPMSAVRIEDAPKQSRSIFPGASSRIPPWALGAAALIAALGGGAGVAEVLRGKPKDNTAQLDECNAQNKRQDEEIKELREYNRKLHSVNEARWDIQNTETCKLNGKAYARGIDCAAVPLEQRPLGAPESQSPGYKLMAEWPFAPRPP